jgi:hypothetical protein
MEMPDSNTYGVVFGAENDCALRFAPSRSRRPLGGVKVGTLGKNWHFGMVYAIGHNSSNM